MIMIIIFNWLGPFSFFSRSLFIWQTFNALIILRVVIKYFIQNLKEDEVLKQFEYRAAAAQAASTSEPALLDQLVYALIDIVNNVEQR